MKILERNGKDKKWKKIFQHTYKNEQELQDLLYEDSTIIPVQEISSNKKPIKVAIKEFGLPGAGSSDVVGIDEKGNITIIETKLAVNPEIRRKVIGQILEYAAFIWKKTYEQFDRVVQLKKGRPLVDLMSDLVRDEDFSEEDFRREVSNNLYNGDFSLIIVVDEIDDNLKRILEFVNSKSFSGPQIYAFVARYYQGESGKEMIVPQFYGVSVKEAESREAEERKYKNWDKDKFFSQVEKRISSEKVKLIKGVYDVFEKIGTIKYGTGFDTGTFGVCSKNNKESNSVWTVDTRGKIRLGLGWLAGSDKLEEKDLKILVNLVRSLADDYEENREWRSYYPAFDVGKLVKKENMEDFISKTKIILNKLNQR